MSLCSKKCSPQHYCVFVMLHWYNHDFVIPARDLELCERNPLLKPKVQNTILQYQFIRILYRTNRSWSELHKMLVSNSCVVERVSERVSGSSGWVLLLQLLLKQEIIHWVIQAGANTVYDRCVNLSLHALWSLLS